MDENRILTTKEVAEYIKVNESTVLKLAQYGELPGYKVDEEWRFHLVTIDHYLQRQFLNSSDEDLDLVINTKENPIPLSRLVNESLIDLDMKAKTKQEVIAYLSKIAADAKITPSYDILLSALQDREEQLSTAVGQEIAMPHPRDPHKTLFENPNIIIARSIEGVDYDSPDNQKVHLFFMPCAPTQFIHVRLLAKISKLLHIPNVIERFKSTQSKEDILRILMAYEQLELLPHPDIENMRQALEEHRDKRQKNETC